MWTIAWRWSCAWPRLNSKLTAVTTVYGDTRLRARMVLKLLALHNDVPVAVDTEKPLLDRFPIYWEGHEGQGILTLRGRCAHAGE